VNNGTNCRGLQVVASLVQCLRLKAFDRHDPSLEMAERTRLAEEGSQRSLAPQDWIWTFKAEVYHSHLNQSQRPNDRFLEVVSLP